MNVPEDILTNDDIRAKYNSELNCDWVSRKLGIAERCIAAPDLKTSDLASSAVRNALRQADIGGDTIDLLIVATATPDRQAPSTACFVQQKGGLTNAVSFDVSAVCSGFLYAMTVASCFLQSGRAKRAMAVGADMFSRITDWSRNDAVFFGDGAGAAILEASSVEHAIFDCELYTNGREADAFTVYPDQRTFSMKAGDVLKAALAAIPQCAERILTRNNLSVNDIDVVIPHQPSINLLKKVSEQTGIGFEKFCLNMDRYANTAGATIPIILHESIENGRVKKDDLVMFAAAGAGFTAGTAVLHWH